MAIRDFLLSELKHKKVSVGEQFPALNLYGNDFEKHTLASLKAKQKMILVFPSLKTSICDLQISQLVQKLKPQLENDQLVLVGLSFDSPLIGAEWCQTKAAKNVHTLSLVGTGHDLVKKLGIYIDECEFLAYRAGFILDENDKVKYVQYAKSLKSELDLEDLLNHL